jgi:hypothetical protein
MSDEPRKVVPRLLGIVALAALFFAAIRTDSPSANPWQLLAKRLRVGMTTEEAYAIVGDWQSGEGSPRYLNVFYYDPTTRTELGLHFDARGRLTAWIIEPPH